MDEEYRLLTERLVIAKLQTELLINESIEVVKSYVIEEAKRLDRELEKLEEAK